MKMATVCTEEIWKDIIGKTGKLFYNEGKSRDEMAEIMQCDKRTVIKRLSVYKKRNDK